MSIEVVENQGGFSWRFLGDNPKQVLVIDQEIHPTDVAAAEAGWRWRLSFWFRAARVDGRMPGNF